MHELVDKLPPSYKLDWVRYKRGKADSALSMFTRFMTEIVSDVSEAAKFSTLSVNERRYARKTSRKEFVHAHDFDQMCNETSSRPCFICVETDHLIRNCEKFRSMSIAERLDEVEILGLCEVCLGKHGNSRCLSRVQCTIRDCRVNHHPLLHRVEKSAHLQQAESDSTVIFRMMPVTLHVGIRQYAFLDEGSSATLVNEMVVKQLDAVGSPEPLFVAWTGNINRLESKSRSVEMMISAKCSMKKKSAV